MPRIRQMRWRIASAYMLLLVTTLALLALALLQVLRATYLETLAAGLEGQARLVATIAGSDLAARPPAERAALAESLHAHLGVRVTLIAADGQVLADAPPLAQANNLATRPEVRDALAVGRGTSERAGIATGEESYYVAVPIGPSGAPTGVARLGVPLTTIGQAQQQLGLTVLLVALPAAGLVLVLAALIAQRTTRPLQTLRTMAARLAGGDLDARAPIPSDDEVAALAEDFNQMASRLRHAELARHMLLANLSHDLRTPLASLQAMIDTLQDGALDDREAALDFLARMDAEVQSLNRLVREVLELTRIEAGQLTLQMLPTDLSALLRNVVVRMQAQAQQRGVHLTVDVPDEALITLIDGPRIEQVLLNLLQNALEFTPHDGQIAVTAATRGQNAVVQVRDTGLGIAPDDLPHIFERFYKADRSRTSSGMGLGLAIVKQLVERHGGQVSATSELGRGTTITLTLPRANA